MTRFTWAACQEGVSVRWPDKEKERIEDKESCLCSRLIQTCDLDYNMSRRERAEIGDYLIVVTQTSLGSSSLVEWNFFFLECICPKAIGTCQ